MPIDPEMLYTPREIAAILRCSHTNVYDLLGESIPTIRVGAGRRCLRVLGRDLAAFIESRRDNGAQAQPKMAIKHPKLR